MKDFMNYDFNITNIGIAIYIKPGEGTRTHKNRALHGIAINTSPSIDDVKKYTFSNNKSVFVGQNEIVYMPKGSSYTVSSKNTGNCYAINFDISENVNFEPFSFNPQNATAFIKDFEKAAKLWKNKSTAFHMQCKGILYKILSNMASEYNSKYMTRNTSNLIIPAIEYIKENYAKDDICISSLSEMCGISEDYFRKIFKNTFGISPRKYINELKISHAEELITSEMYTVTEAAELSGYTDMSYFSREFKKAFGICPADYRKHEGVALIQ